MSDKIYYLVNNKIYEHKMPGRDDLDEMIVKRAENGVLVLNANEIAIYAKRVYGRRWDTSTEFGRAVEEYILGDPHATINYIAADQEYHVIEFDDEFLNRAERIVATVPTTALSWAMSVACERWDENTDLGRTALLSISQSMHEVFTYSMDMNYVWPRNTEYGLNAYASLFKSEKYVYTYSQKFYRYNWPVRCKYYKKAMDIILARNDKF